MNLNSTEIIESNQKINTERVDFSNPSSILNYGSELLNQMGNLIENMSKVMKTEDFVDVKLIEKIHSLEEFSFSLEDQEKNQKNKLANPVLKIIGKIPPFVKKNKTLPTYFDIYEEYCKKIIEIANAIETQKNNTLTDIEINTSLINKIKQYIEDLENLISIGEQDLERFNKQIVLSLQRKYESTGSNYDQKQLLSAQQMMQVFQDKLQSLRITLITAKNTIVECQINQKPNMDLVLMYENYNRDVIPVLKVHAVSIITTKRQEAKIAMQGQLVEATNKILSENAETLKRNIAEVNQLVLEGNVKIDTLQEMNKNVEEAIQLIKTGYEQHQKEREKNEKLLKNINVSLDQHQNNVRELLISNNEKHEFSLDETENEENHSGKGPYVLRKGNTNK